MARVVIVGGGWAGCAAALTARQAGADEVLVLERTDSLLGTGLVGGIMRNNGRFTAAEEMAALGAGELFVIADAAARHRNVAFPGHQHATLYDVAIIEPAVRQAVLAHGAEVWLMSRVTGIARSNGSLSAVQLENGTLIEGDAFIDTTGTVGSQSFCTEHGNGCVMCVARCPTFGPRTSLTGLAGIPERSGKRADGGIGAMSGSCKLNKDTVARDLLRRLENAGVLVIPLPRHLVNLHKLGGKACQQYASAEFAENVVLLDTGQIKLMTSYMPLEQLRQVPGLENVRYEDPYSGTVGNSMRYSQLSPRDDSLRVLGGPENVFCGGEKAGLLVGHTEAIVTGALAGHNAVRHLAGKQPLVLPDTLACGDAIGHVRAAMETEAGLTKKYTFSGSVYFERMLARGLYTTDLEVIAARVAAAGLANVYQQRVL
ncbi:MAG: FAD-dependent oxidoreductase [Anaerolineales bacterium]|nr:FAD-dependent oxidoreductase [Anaerolineales bacterium]